MKDRKKEKEGKISYIFTRETFGVTLLLFSLVVLLMLFSYNAIFAGIGAAVCTFMYGTFGYGSFLIIALLAYFGVWLAFEKKLKISFKKTAVICVSVFVLFLLFHAASTHWYQIGGYGKYISDCYTNAQYGFSGYSAGGVISAIFVYPILALGGFVTAYVIFSVLALLCGYLMFSAFKGTLLMGRLRKIKIKDSEVKESYEIPMIESSEPQIYVPEPASPDVKPEETKVVAEETGKFSQKNLGRRILFEKGEFAAESYRRNMIFNENSYFNHPVTSEADYLSSFTSNPEKFSAENQAPKSYSQSYQEEIYNQPASMPSSHVIDERSDGYGYNSVYNQQAEEYSVVEEQSFPDYNFGDEAETYSDDDYSVRGAENNYQNRDDYSSQPSAARNIAGFSENTQEKEEFTSPEVNSEPEPVKSDKLFHNESTPVNETSDRFIQKERERSKSELFDSDDDEDDILSVGTERSGRTERVDRSENINTVRSERSVPQVDLGRGVQRKPEEPKRVERRAEPIPEQPEKVEEKPKHVWQKYVRPTLDLLDDYPENSNVNTGEIEDNKRTIVQALERYKIASEVANVTIGPSITRYDVIIQDKTNIKRSLGYRDAIAMELMKENVTAYLNYSKGALSIEVPNNQRAIVGLKTMLASQKFINSKRNSLTFALGKNVEGEVVCPDITKMPHLLVAGTTGSGKSICLSALLVSLLYKYGPEELRLILVDPKQVEFISYDKLPHLMINEIIYDVDKAIKALNWAIKEMERRYTLFKDMTEKGVATKNLDEYNAHLPDGEEKLPKIVIILDEFGDLMLQAKKDIESRIIKLVQKARACGIHLILATQRPSVDCITGLIKSNLPTRIGFKVNSFDDARTIFDIGGAEKLLGKGDSYFRSAENPDLARIQCCFVDTHEVQKVTDFVKAHNETYFDQSVSDFINRVEQEETASSMVSGGDGGEDAETKIDDTFIKALKYCVTSNQASVSMIQRRFPVGYIKACKIIDWMENMTYVTPSEGSKPRKVLLSKDEFFNIYGDVDD